MQATFHNTTKQRAKNFVFNNPDFAFGLVNSVLNLPDGQVRFFKEFKLKKTCEMNPAHQKAFWTS